MSMIPGIVDTPFSSIFNQMFEQRQAFKDHTPGSRTLIFHAFPHDAGDDRKAIEIVRIAGDLVHERARRAPIFVGQAFVNAGFDIGLGFHLIDTDICTMIEVVMAKREKVRKSVKKQHTS